MAFRAALATLGVALASGCRAPQLASRNLDELHDAGARHRHVARIQSGWGYFLSRVFDPRILRRAEEREADLEEVEDPSDVCLTNLLRLSNARSRAGDVRATLVRHFAWLGVEDPFGLSRERALLELGQLAAEMDLAEPVTEPEAAANAPDLSEAIAGLASATRRLLEEGRRAGPTARADFEAACELLGSMDFDLEGGRRLLGVLAALVARVPDGVALFEPLLRLNAEVQEQLVGLALARSLSDPDPRVRAAAIEANWRAYKERFLAEAVLALDGRPRDETDPPSPFALAEVWPGDEEVFVRVFTLVREHGLPLDGASPERKLELLHVLCQVAVDYTAYGDRSRTAAMLALGAVSGAGISSLRLEDWQEWWRDFAPSELEALRG